MTITEHKKHTDLVRAYGNFGRKEWAFVGGRCSSTKLLADNLIKALSPLYKCAYMDSLHEDQMQPLPDRLTNGAYCEYTDRVNYQQLSFQYDLNHFKFREMFAGADIVFTNGNHHPATAQVVVINEKKRASLLKRMGQLSNVQLILLDGASDVFDFFKEAFPNWQQIPIFRFSDTAKIITFFEEAMLQAEPKLNGLVLAGGKSIRMGADKQTMNWHGKEQQYYLADLLKNYCDDVFISCREDQQASIDNTYQTLSDTFTGLGPFGAIASAFREHPDRAWLVVASDLPLIDAKTVEYLIAHRLIPAVATAYRSEETGFPEPLIAIWEPKAYPALLSFLAQGFSCPRKTLINSDTHVISAPNPEVLANVNTPGDAEYIRKKLKSSKADSE